MKSAEIVEFLAKLQSQERVHFLAQLSNTLTIIAREAYQLSETDATAHLLKINELQHRVSRMILNVVDGKPLRPDAHVAEYLFSAFSELGALDALNSIVSRVR